MKKVFLLSALLLSASIIFAKPVSKDFAGKIAYNCYKHYESSKSSNFAISNSFEIKYDGITTMYVFNFSPGGFVIVAADDASIPVLGQSGTGEIKENSNNPNLNWWLSQYSKEIKQIVNNNLSNKQTIAKWNEIANGNFSRPAKDIQDVANLLSTTWNQDSPYNDSCPGITSGPGGNAWAGCVAVATSQIMRYHAYPSTGIGSHTYITRTNKWVCKADFGIATYNWGTMPNSGANAALAKAMFHVAVSVDMDFNSSGSGAYSSTVPGALMTYFDYQPCAEIKSKSNYTDVQWKTMIKNELDATRPVYYSGDGGTGAAGHAFVCCGWRTSDGAFYFNWGWDGSSDGWYTIGNLNPGSNFNSNNQIVIRIKPKTNAPIASFKASTYTPVASAAVNFTDQSLNTPTAWTWTFEGGTPATSNAQSPSGVTFATNGKKLVSLRVSNATGNDIKYALINVGGTPAAWIQQVSGFTNSRGVQNISIVDAQTVWALAYNGADPTSTCFDFLRTTNGGTTWGTGTIPSASFPPGFDAAYLNAISDQIAWVAVNPGASTGGYVLKTTDGGANWATQTTANFTGSWADFVYFFNATDGVCMGDPKTSPVEYVIYTTTNGGTNWTQVPVGNIPNPTSGEAGIEGYVDAVGNTIWFGTSLGRVYKSTNKGLNWTVAAVTGLTAGTHPFFSDDNGLVGIAVQYADATTAAPYATRRTTNGGTSWSTLTPTGAFTKHQVDFVPGTTNMWVSTGLMNTAGAHYGSSYSTNDGTSFINIDTGSVQYTTVKFKDINTGWAGGFNNGPLEGGMWKWDPSIITQILEDAKTSVYSVDVYPNPSNGIYNVKFNGTITGKTMIEVYDMLGNLVKNEEINLSSWGTYQLDMCNENSGLYFVNIITGNQHFKNKILLTK
ncbi:MAG: C10 family peptidase [Bacteroidales bacterium]|nr:C10 family peptidase [Bacteroidales bacterium]